MTKQEYEAYLQTPRWRLISRTIRDFRRVCEKCVFPYELNVHHKTYERIGKELDTDLIVLCRSCHAREHFLEDLEEAPASWMLDEAGTLAAKGRLKVQQKEAKKKNIERQHEIKQNREREQS